MAIPDARILPVILSGGSGSRLWPASRETLPKQFLTLTGSDSLFEQTAARVSDSERFGPLMVVANNEHRFLVAERLRAMDIAPPTILLEPCSRNTAPAAVSAALMAQRRDPDAVVLLLPSDHLIRDNGAFHRAIAAATPAARAGAIVLFGVPPDAPATGYGYILKGRSTDSRGEMHHASQFIEKPDLATARQYHAAGGYLWNSGIFLLTARRLIAEIERFEPEVLRAVSGALDHATADMDFLRLDRRQFEASPSISLDHAVMERASDIHVLAADMGWADLGSWSALKKTNTADEQGNVMSGNVVTREVTNSYLRSEGPLIAALGVSDITIVATSDAVLVSSSDRDQDVRFLVDALRKEGHAAATQSPTVHRPWGSYQQLHTGARFQVKCITVKPGARLSLQRHRHRAEHWVVVSGTAHVSRDGEEFLLRENESTFLPLGCVHRLANKEPAPLNLIEVQSGDYLGEDDIERFDDDYSRHQQ